MEIHYIILLKFWYPGGFESPRVSIEILTEKVDPSYEVAGVDMNKKIKEKTGKKKRKKPTEKGIIDKCKNVDSEGKK